jgi:hypothetical protein
VIIPLRCPGSFPMKNMIITIAIVLLMSLLLEIQTDMNLMALGRLSGR